MRAAHGIGRLPASPAASTLGKATRRLATAASSYGRVGLQPCPAEDAWLSCGTVRVPLNRADPHDPRTIGIHVELSLHSAVGPPKGVIVLEAGGPGTAISRTKPGYFDALLGDLPQTFDIVLIDQRGVGQSEAIDCADLEQAVTTGQRYAAARACRDSLGDRAQLFSTRAVADDIESVRTALGVDKINLFGNSYAGNDVVTYAVRHRAHVRSVVTTSAELTPGEDTFWGSVPRALPGITRALCARSTSCAAAVSSPTSELSWLAASLRRHPLQGTYVDGEGITHSVQLTEAKLLNWLLPNPGYEWAGPGEVAQAARAFRGGDPTPLLRLAGQNDLEPGPAGFDPAFFSTGHNLARRCVDEPFPWAKSAETRAAHDAVREGTRRAAGVLRPVRQGCVVASGHRWSRPEPDATGPVHRQHVGRRTSIPGRDDGAARAYPGDEWRVRLGRPDLGRAPRHRGAHRQHVRPDPRGVPQRVGLVRVPGRARRAVLPEPARRVIVLEGAGVSEVVPRLVRPRLLAAAGGRRWQRVRRRWPRVAP